MGYLLQMIYFIVVKLYGFKNILDFPSTKMIPTCSAHQPSLGILIFLCRFSAIFFFTHIPIECRSLQSIKKKKNNIYFIHLIVYAVCAVHTLVRRYSATRVGVRHRSWCTRGPGSTGTGILSRESAPAAMGGTRAKGDHDGVTAGTCTTRTRVVLLLSYFIMLGKKTRAN